MDGLVSAVTVSVSDLSNLLWTCRHSLSHQSSHCSDRTAVRSRRLRLTAMQCIRTASLKVATHPLWM